MGLLAWLWKRKKSEPPSQDAIGEMRCQVERDVAMGFIPLEAIIDTAIRVLSDEYRRATLRPIAERLAHDAINRHIRAQAEWPTPTDCERLDNVFSELERAGIVSRHHFSCCSTCGSYEIWDEIEDTRKAGTNVRGYTFYDIQDAESAATGHGLWLNYGSVLEGESASLHIGREVVDTLQRNGLKTKWSGVLKERIFAELDWKRRRTNIA